MHKTIFSLLIVSLLALVGAQTPIPPIPGYPIDHSTCTSIGDFDGDGSVDICIIYADNVGNAIMGIYSVKKAKYLFTETKKGLTDQVYRNLIFGDFDGDGKNEIVLSGILYAYSSTMSKKKN
jgi:hypothetical protein